MIGHDSEFTLISQKGKPISALDAKVRGRNQYGRFFPDNLNQEIAINPVSSLEDWHTATESLLQECKDRGYHLVFNPTMTYGAEALNHRKANQSGCNRDMNAYKMTDNIPPDLRRFGSLRSAGAHVHVSEISDLNPFEVVKSMDLHLALPLLRHEKPSVRRQLYGKAGDMRLKPYGIEYRTLSNVWLPDPILREFVYLNTYKSIEYLRNGGDLPEPQKIQDAINNHDLSLAEEIMQAFNMGGI